MTPLDQVQREFLAALQLPLRGRSRASTELQPVAEGHAEVFMETAGRLLKEGPNLTPAESLELYHRQYWFRLLDSIAEDFPILRRMAGEERFWSLMEAYLLARPSTSFTLRHLGSRLPEFIAAWDGVDETRRRWFSAIALLEYAEMEIYEAAEWEPVRPDQLATSDLALQPHVRLLELPVAADLCAGWERFSPEDETTTHLAVWRGDHGAAMRCRLDPVEFVLLGRLRSGGLLASLFEEPTGREPEPDEIATWFGNWQGRRWIAIRPTGGGEDLTVVHRRKGGGDADWSGVDKMGSQARAMEE